MKVFQTDMTEGAIMWEDVRMKKRLIYLFIGMVILLVIMSLVNKATSGRLIITTNSPEYVISLRNAGDKNARTNNYIKQAKNNLDVTLRSGKYVVSVQGKNVSISKVVEVKPHKTTSYNISPKTPMDFEPVLSGDQSSIIADKNRLLYIDSVNGHLSQIDNQNSLTILNSSVFFKSIKWVNTDYGLGQDKEGVLYIIDNGSVNRLVVPFQYDKNTPINYSISKNKQIYISKGSVVYSSQSENTFKKIYTGESSSPILSAGKEKVAIITGGGEEGVESKPQLVLVDRSNGTVIKKDLEVYTMGWSSDGKYLAVGGSTAGYILDSSLDQVAIIPNVNISNQTWLNNKTLLYAVDNQLWVYGVEDSQSTVLAAGIADVSIDEVSVSGDSSYVYVVLGKKNSSSLDRVSLHGQKGPYYVYQFPSFLPDNSHPCSLDYINFNQVTVVGYSESDPDQNCANAIKTVFEPYGIDTDLLNYRFIQTPTEFN